VNYIHGRRSSSTRGAAYESDREEGLRAGAREYVAKPGIDRLSEAVRRALDGGMQTGTEGSL
jgi:CheY-like chemotaxis protein